MSKKKDNENSEDEEEEDAGVEIISDFLKRHEKDISLAIQTWVKNFEKAATRRFWVIFGVFSLAALIIVLTGYLTFTGKLSSDAFTFLIGSIVGYMFSYLKTIHTVNI